MGRLSFFMGTMASGKTTHLLHSHYNAEDAFGAEVMLLNKNDRSGESVCTNRTGSEANSIAVTDDTALTALVAETELKKDVHIKYIFVDEVQFFTTSQIEQMATLADTNDIDVNAYGLLTPYKGELFPTVKRLLELSDRVIQINNGIRCQCGRYATHNALYINGRGAQTGDDTVVDNSDGVEYKVMCRKHFLQHIQPPKDI